MVRWALHTAGRDARRNLGALLLIVGTMVIGVAGIVALHGFRDALLSEMQQQSKSLFGADLSVKLRGGFTADHEQFLDRIGGERVREVQFTSMAFFPATQQTRLVVVSAVGQGYPLYGALVTEPVEAARRLSGTTQALVDSSLMAQFGLAVGDVLRLGEADFTIGGALKQIPGAIDMQGVLAPRVIISLSELPETSLLRTGSRVRSTEFYKLPSGSDAEEIVARLKSRAAELYLNFDTSASKQASFQRVVKSMSNYTRLVALVALILGAVGAASMAHVYIRRRRRDIGVLRCLGASRAAIVAFFVVQIGTAGLLGVTLGALLGLGIQQLLPMLFQEFLLVEVQSALGWRAPLFGAAIGMFSLFAFSVVPVLQVGRVSPMSILRLDASAEEYRLREKVLFVLLAGGATLICAYLVTGLVVQALLYTALLVLVTASLFLLAELGIALVSRLRAIRGPFAMRQGIANISRPQNQTRVLLVVLGLGSFLVLFVSLVRVMTLARIERLNTTSEPNVIAFDVQPDQLEGVVAEARRHGLSVFATTAMVTMRLTEVKGVPVSDLLKRSRADQPRWPLTRVYRSSYRAALDPSEQVVAGEVVAQVEPGTTPIPVTLEQRIARELQVGLGDRLVFDVQGLPIEVQVRGIRVVDWQQVKPNFFVIFPEGVLEDAPQTHIITARSEGTAPSVAFQQSLVQKFSNVSVIDLQLIQQSVQVILGRLSYAAQMLGLLCVAVAVVMLIGTVLSTREQRVREFQILKFLGATQRTILLISCAEYGLISVVAVSFGTLFAYIAATLLSVQLFDQTVISGDVSTLVLALALVVGGVLLSILATLGTYRRPAVELLR